MTKAMQEEEMGNVHELDGCDEAEGQRLLTAAYETAPVGDGRRRAVRVRGGDRGGGEDLGGKLSRDCAANRGGLIG
jgi:hypothetical protein